MKTLELTDEEMEYLRDILEVQAEDTMALLEVEFDAIPKDLEDFHPAGPGGQPEWDAEKLVALARFEKNLLAKFG